MDPVSLFWILMIFFPPPGLWEAFGVIGILAMVAMALLWLMCFLFNACYGAIGLGRRLVQGDRLVICWTVIIVYFATPLVGECIIAFTH